MYFLVSFSTKRSVNNGSPADRPRKMKINALIGLHFGVLPPGRIQTKKQDVEVIVIVTRQKFLILAVTSHGNI